MPVPTDMLSPLETARLETFYDTFCQPGKEKHLWLAAHAAFPAVLSVDLLYKIWQNFRVDEQGQEMDIPSIAVSDVLLSDLCRPVSKGLYEIQSGIRSALLDYLANEDRFGKKRIQRLAHFLKFYLRDNPQRIPSEAFRRAQTFAFQAELEPEKAAQLLLEAWNRGDRARLQQLEEAAQYLSTSNRRMEAGAYSNPLAVAIDLVREVSDFQRGRIEQEDVVRYLDALREVVEIDVNDGIRLKIPPAVLEALRRRGARRMEASGEERHFAKIHLLTHPSLDQEKLAARLFNQRVDPAEPLNCFQWKTDQHDLGLIGKTTFNTWMWSSSLHTELDRFLFTPGGMYFLAIPGDLKRNGLSWLKEVLYRVQSQVGQYIIYLLPIGEAGELWKELDTDRRSELEAGKVIPLLKRENFNQIFEEIFEKGKLPNPLPVNTISVGEDLAWNIQKEPFQEILLKEISAQEQDQYLPQLEKLNAAGLVRYEFTGEKEAPLVATAPQQEVKRLTEWLEKAKDEKGLLVTPAVRRLRDARQTYRFIRTLAMGIQPVDGEMLFPTMFEKGMRKQGLEASPTIIFRWTYDFLPTDLWLRVLSTINREFRVEEMSTRDPLIFKMDGLLATLSQEKENTLELRIADSSDAIPTPLQALVAGKSAGLLEKGPLGPGVHASYPYPLSFRKQTLRIPAHATPELIRVEGGTFTMGWLNEERDGEGYDDEKPAHEVRLKDFSIGRYSVTMQEYDAFCEATGRDNPKDSGWGRGRRPAIYVDWYDAIEYCNWLSEIWGLEKVYEISKDKKDPNNKNDSDNKKWLVTMKENANGYRLPTEAEWEYAARGGQESKGFQYAGSNDLDEVAWHDKNAGSKTHPVGEKKPNELGLYDMSGNVYEWSWDWYDGEYYQLFSNEVEENPLGPESGSGRVLRGGSWSIDNGRYYRVSSRYWYYPGSRLNDIGFRLAQD